MRSLNYVALLGLPSFKSNSWRGYPCVYVLLVCEGKVRELVQPSSTWGLPWGLLCWTSCRKELCMVPCHSSHIDGTWTSRSKKMWGMFKSHNWGSWCNSLKGDFLGRFSLCNTAVLWNFIAIVLLGIYCKRFYQIPLFTILLLFYVFEVSKAKSATQSVLMILTLNRLFQKIF